MNSSFYTPIKIKTADHAIVYVMTTTATTHYDNTRTQITKYKYIVPCLKQLSSNLKYFESKAIK